MPRGVKKTTTAKTAVHRRTIAPKKVIPSAKSYVVLGTYVREATGKLYKNKGHELEKGYRPLNRGGVNECAEGKLEAGVVMAEAGRHTEVEAKPCTAAQQKQREEDAEVVRDKCEHDLPLTKNMPLHYEGCWICDDCEFEGKAKVERHHCKFCFVDVCKKCFKASSRVEASGSK